MPKFEAHMTFDKEHSPKLKEGFNGYSTRWQYSAIDDDPIMGQKPYCYLTNYSTDPNELLDDMALISMELNDLGVPTLRTKVERIIFDSKTGVNELKF